MARVSITGAGCVIVAVNLINFMGPAGTDVVGPDPSLYRTSNELAGVSNLFPLLDELTVSEFVSETFPMAESRNHESFRGYERYVVFGRQDNPIGFIYEIQEDLRCSVCNNVRLLVALDGAGEIREIKVLESLELSGEPMPLNDEVKFINQFRLNPSVTPFVLGENVDGITGATESSIHIVDALNRLLFAHRS